MIRRLSILLGCAAVWVAALPSTARAGTYTVRACHSDGVNNSWQSFRYNGFADAYSQCPADMFVNGRANEGMVARNTGGPGTAPYFSHARMFFDAPPGARITHVSGHIKQNSTGGWHAGLHEETGNRWVWCGPGCTSTFGTWVPFSVGLSTSRVAALAMCTSGSGCARNGLHGYAAIRDVSVVVADEGAPSVAIKGGGLVAAGWRRGVQSLVVDASDPVGVRQTRSYVDGRKSHDIGRPCDFSRASPCPSGANTVTIDTRPYADGRHMLRVEAIDTAGNLRAQGRTISIDNQPPARPVGLTVDGGTGWRSRDSFGLMWANPKQAAAPINRALLELCALGAECLPPRALGRVTSAAVKVPRAGEWRARIWLEDAAGNGTRANASEAILRVDSTAPTVMFQRPTTDRPALVRVAATDAGSGLGAREILVRRRSSPAWISLPVSAQPRGFSAFIDDEKLPDGVYELRARAVDLAGNERSTDRLSDGKVFRLALPLRIKTNLRVGRPTRVRARGARGKRRYRIKLVEAPRAGYGRTIPLRGRLTSPGGNPLTSREVQVFAQTHLASSPWRLIATVRTNRTGRFTFKALRGPSRTLRFRYGGSDTIRGRTANVRLGVRAAISMRASRHRVVNGEDVTFRGRLRGRPLPTPGKLIELQAYARGKWQTFGTTRANPRTGRWSFPYRFSATRGSVRYRFRARVPKEASYPYETGASTQVKVSVRGL